MIYLDLTLKALLLIFNLIITIPLLCLIYLIIHIIESIWKNIKR